MARSEHTIREAVAGDCEELQALFAEHAQYEGAAADIVASPQDIAASLFGAQPAAKCFVAELDGRLAGYVTGSLEYSTWRAQHYLHMDCLYLREWARGQGLGTRLFSALLDWTRAGGLRRMEWQTPAGNTPAIGFYQRLGATHLAKARFSMTV